MKIYHNTNCSKSCKALNLLLENNFKFDIKQYIHQSLTREELIDLLKKLDMQPLDIIRTTDSLFIEKFQDKEYSFDQWIQVIIENPTLLQRPIVVLADKAIIARPPERVLELL
ncbi:ArsC/Spx/MgsR family protein [Myroides sp. LJL119]